MLCIILEYLDADDWADNADLDQTVLRRSLIGLCSVCLYATSQLISTLPKNQADGDK